MKFIEEKKCLCFFGECQLKSHFWGHGQWVNTNAYNKTVWFCHVVQTNLNNSSSNWCLFKLSEVYMLSNPIYHWQKYDGFFLCFRNEMSTNDLSFSFLSFILCTHRRTLALVVHTPLVKKGSTRRCSSTHISIHSFICSFSLAFSIFIPLWHTLIASLFEEIDCSSSLCYCCCRRRRHRGCPYLYFLFRCLLHSPQERH